MTEPSDLMGYMALLNRDLRFNPPCYYERYCLTIYNADSLPNKHFLYNGPLHALLNDSYAVELAWKM